MVEAASELRKVRQELRALLDRMTRDFSAEDREQYVRLLAREELLLIELGRNQPE